MLPPADAYCARPNHTAPKPRHRFTALRSAHPRRDATHSASLAVPWQRRCQWLPTNTMLRGHNGRAPYSLYGPEGQDRDAGVATSDVRHSTSVLPVKGARTSRHRPSRRVSRTRRAPMLPPTHSPAQWSDPADTRTPDPLPPRPPRGESAASADLTRRRRRRLPADVTLRGPSERKALINGRRPEDQQLPALPLDAGRSAQRDGTAPRREQ